jgi:hypothetical protein
MPRESPADDRIRMRHILDAASEALSFSRSTIGWASDTADLAGPRGPALPGRCRAWQLQPPPNPGHCDGVRKGSGADKTSKR